MNKTKILKHLCYTELVYDRINKKLKTNLSKVEIEQFIYKIISETDEADFQKTGKNYYIFSPQHSIRITVNSQTYRIITVDKTN